MKKEYIIKMEKLIRIETPEYVNWIGKYYLDKLENGKDCFYKITSIDVAEKTPQLIRLYTALGGVFNYRDFDIDELPVFYELKTEEREVLFNVF